MTRPLGVAALVLAVLVSAAHAEPVQITIAPPAEATTDPGRSTQVQAVTPTAVRIVTKKPDPLLLVRLAQMGAQILPARQTTDEGVKELARRPVGTGAYRFVSRDYCFTETPRTTNPGFVATNGTSRLLSVRTKSKLSVPVPPVRIVQTADPVPLGFTVYVPVKVWWSTTPPALRVGT